MQDLLLLAVVGAAAVSGWLLLERLDCILENIRLVRGPYGQICPKDIFSAEPADIPVKMHYNPGSDQQDHSSVIIKYGGSFYSSDAVKRENDRQKPSEQNLGPPHTVRKDGTAGTRGKLKIFFGYAAGVGKTCAMLRAARQAKERGTDVAAGYIETHACPQTEALLAGLERIPERQAAHGRGAVREFDIDAALKRKPQILLLDEFAHQPEIALPHRFSPNNLNHSVAPIHVHFDMPYAYYDMHELSPCSAHLFAYFQALSCP